MITWKIFSQEKCTNAQKHLYTNISCMGSSDPRNHLWSWLRPSDSPVMKCFSIIFKCKYSRINMYLWMPVVWWVNSILTQACNYQGLVYDFIMSLHKQNLKESSTGHILKTIIKHDNYMSIARYSKSFSSWITSCKIWVETDLFCIFSSSVKISDKHMWVTPNCHHTLSLNSFPGGRELSSPTVAIRLPITTHLFCYTPLLIFNLLNCILSYVHL